ncbi:CGP-CTERM sorting domain-containing protein [Thermococcus sp. Bubb.Bath]|uniref:CGP-CTERM sorting domain-containing protein n=1 Tax=Thermococcus sp. Bubb.Bath TaxID=1638242 RepID=UPI00143A9642|nr:CGP-CTERM sorting domain-containing protein [Thermococcus sp. Bubb.Bath]
MKDKYLVLIVSILLLSSAVASAEAWKFDASKVHFYMYGVATCPHCQRMKKFIPEAYGYNKFTYYELIDNEHNDAIFRNISRLTGITGVPAIGITYNGTLAAVIEGEFNVSATPDIVKTAFKHNGTLLFVGGKTYILPWNNTNATKVINELKEYFLSGEPEVLTTTATEKTSTTTNTGETNPVDTTSPAGSPSTSNNRNSICGPGLVVLATLIPVVIIRRRR